jgi:hypothetical protein
LADARTQALEDAITLLAELSSEQGGALNRVKLAKLLYLLELRAWREFGHGVTGIEWRWDNYGPYSVAIPEACTRMETTDELALAEISSYYGSSEYRIRSRYPRYFRQPNPATKKLAQEIMAEYGLWTASALKALTYKTEPMQLIQQNGRRGDVLDLAPKEYLLNKITNYWGRTA